MPARRSLLLVALASLVGPAASPPASPGIAANDNRVPAGQLANGVLTLRLEAREGIWYPDADSSPGLPVQAFGEVGKALQVPGPLIRVPAGTEVHLTITNRIDGRTLVVHGLHPRPIGAVADTLRVAAGATRELRFRLDAPGAYAYWGATTDSTFLRRVGSETQLAGGIVVDPPGARPRDRVFVITEYIDLLDPGAAAAPRPGALLVPAINGKSWPHTERITHAIGDSVHWRWINATGAAHPMHLHGFYFRVDARGDDQQQTTYAGADAPYEVTERIPAGGSMAMMWVPERAGNWLLHCHVPLHVEAHRPLDGSAMPMQHDAHTNHTLQGMGGLVLGIHVTGEPNPPPPGNSRRLRLVALVDTASTSEHPAYRFALDAPDERAATGIGLMLNPVLVLEQNEPVAITVVNALPEPTSVHWHGIELESYFDGVAGFGGTPGHVSPVIEPGDSFIAYFTPPRAGTFIYHTHVDELRQEPAGLSGVIVVMERGQRFDPSTDHPVLLTTPRDRDRFSAMLNNSWQPTALEWHAGEKHRFRIVNMTVAPPAGYDISLAHDSTRLPWLPVQKDGATLAAPRPRSVPTRITIGETHDFEATISEPGDYRLAVDLALNVPAKRRPVWLPIRVH